MRVIRFQVELFIVLFRSVVSVDFLVMKLMVGVMLVMDVMEMKVVVVMIGVCCLILESLVMLCVDSWWLMILMIRNSVDLNSVCLMIRVRLVSVVVCVLQLIIIVKNLSWLMVLKVRMCFRFVLCSVWMLLSSIVKMLSEMMIGCQVVLNVKIGVKWVMRQMLVFIMVVVCRQVFIGVGVVIVFGSQKWNGNNVDLLIVLISSIMIVVLINGLDGVILRILWMFDVLVLIMRRMILMNIMRLLRVVISSVCSVVC